MVDPPPLRRDSRAFRHTNAKGGSTKPQRKGMGPVKRQIRGLERLLAKMQDYKDDEAAAKRESIQKSLEGLYKDLEVAQFHFKEQENAKKSHQSRFLDRRRLVRLWNSLIKEKQRQHHSGTTNKKKRPRPSVPDSRDEVADEKAEDANKSINYNDDPELFKLGLNMLYVAHFPLGATGYSSIPAALMGAAAPNKQQNNNNNSQQQQPAPPQKVAWFPQGRKLAKIVGARQRILGNVLPQLPPAKRASWIPTAVYEQMTFPTDWSVAVERQTFGYPDKETLRKMPSSRAGDDDRRFQVAATSSSMDAVLQAADAVDAELDEEEAEREKNESDGEKGSDEEEDDESHDREEKEDGKKHQVSTASSGGKHENLRSDSEGSNGSSSSSEDERKTAPIPNVGRASTTSRLKGKNDVGVGVGSSSSSSSDDDSDEEEEVAPAVKVGQRKDARSSNSDEGDQVHTSAKVAQKQDTDTSSNSDDDSSDNSSSSSSADSNRKRKKHKSADPSDSLSEEQEGESKEEEGSSSLLQYGFLTTADVDPSTLFTKRHIPDRPDIRTTGDKSQGWASQRQRPGQFQKRRRPAAPTGNNYDKNSRNRPDTRRW